MSSNGFGAQTPNLKFVKSERVSRSQNDQPLKDNVKHEHGHMTHGQSLEIEPT